MTQVLERLAYVLRAETEGLANDLKGAESHFGKFTKFVERNPLAAAGALGAALTGVGVKATQMALEVERSLHRIERVVPGAVGKLGQLREAIEQASRSSPRTQAEFATAADAIAKGGVESIEALQQRLVAGARAADASGGDLIGILGGLDQALDLFGASSAEAEGMLAKLFATAKGRVAMEDLFAALQAAAPTIRDLDLDFDTAARALGALLEQGKTAKQAGSELKAYGELGAEGAAAIRQLAESHVIATDAIADYSTAVKAARETQDALWQTAKNNFSAAMIDLGQTILPIVTAELRGIVGLIERIRNVNFAQDLNSAAVTVRAGRLDTPGNIAAMRASLLKLNGNASQLVSGMSLQELGQMQQSIARFEALTGQATGQFELLKRSIAAAQIEASKLALAQRETAAPGSTTTPGAAGVTPRTPEQIKADQDARARALAAQAEAMAELAKETKKGQREFKAAALENLRLLADWSKAYNRLKGDVMAFKEAEAELLAVMEGKQVGNLKEDVQSFKARESAALEDLVRSISQAVSGAIALASAFGEVDATTAAALQNISQIGQGVASMMGGKGDVGTYLQIAGNIAALAKSAFGRSQTDVENDASSRAIDRLADRLGDLLGANISGNDFGRIRAATTNYLGATARQQQKASIAFLDPAAFYEALGIPYADVQRLAKSLGVTLNNTAESFRNLDRALAEADFAAYIDSFVGQLDLLNDRFEVYGITDPTERFRKVLEALMDPETGAPAIFTALAGLDLSTSEGQAQARTILQGIFDKGAIGGFSGDLGGLTPEQLIGVVKQLLGYLGGGAASTAAAGGNLGIVSGFRGLTEAAGNRMADYLRALVDIGRQELNAILALTAPVLLPPSLGTASAGGAGGVSISVQVTQNFHGSSDPVSIGRAASDGVRAGVEEALTFTGVVRARRAAGNLKAVT